MTTKILALTDALGNLVRFELLPGNRGVAPLIEGIEFGALLGDKAFDAHWIVEDLDRRGAKIKPVAKVSFHEITEIVERLDMGLENETQIQLIAALRKIMADYMGPLVYAAEQKNNARSIELLALIAKESAVLAQRLALQLRFYFDMSPSGGGLMGASPT